MSTEPGDCGPPWNAHGSRQSLQDPTAETQATPRVSKTRQPSCSACLAQGLRRDPVSQPWRPRARSPTVAGGPLCSRPPFVLATDRQKPRRRAPPAREHETHSSHPATACKRPCSDTQSWTSWQGRGIQTGGCTETAFKLDATEHIPQVLCVGRGECSPKEICGFRGVCACVCTCVCAHMFPGTACTHVRVRCVYTYVCTGVVCTHVRVCCVCTCVCMGTVCAHVYAMCACVHGYCLHTRVCMGTVCNVCVYTVCTGMCAHVCVHGYSVHM